jgi:hypothetical protein
VTLLLQTAAAEHGYPYQTSLFRRIVLVQGHMEDAFDSSYQVLQASPFSPLHQTTEEPVSCSQYKVTMGRAVDWNGFRFAWIPTSDEKSVVVRYQALDALVTFDKNYYSFD